MYQLARHVESPRDIRGKSFALPMETFSQARPTCKKDRDALGIILLSQSIECTQYTSLQVFLNTN